MLKNYLTVALRNLLRHRLFSFINIFGLALSLSFCLLVVVIINDQNSFDRFHPRDNDVYRVLTAAHRKNGDTEKYASSPHPLGAVLQRESPAVERVVRLTRGLSGEATFGQVRLPVSGFFADQSFFDVFGFDLADGDPTTALSNPNAIVLSDETAQKFFGEADPMGKTLTLVGRADLTVTGVLAPLAGKTHLEFDILGSAAALPAFEGEGRMWPSSNNWRNYYMNYNYVRLREGANASEVEPLLATIPEKYYGKLDLESRDRGYSFELQPLRDITPGPQLSNSLGSAMPEVMLIFLSAVAALGVLAAIFNYTGLTLARSLMRAKEVGIRKVTGALRRQLFLQFLGESILLVLIAVVAAEPLLRALLVPGFERLQLTQSLDVSFAVDGKVYLLFLALAIVIGTIAGLLPASIISAFRPTKVLKDISKTNVLSKLTLRKALVVFQFALSITLMIVVTAVYKQIGYALRMDYGFARENMVNIRLQGNDHDLVARQMAQHPDVASYSAVSHNMGTWEDSSTDVRKNWDDEPVAVRDYSVDARFVEHFGLTVVAGRNFSQSAEGLNRELVLVNQRFVDQFQLGAEEEAVGQTLVIGDSDQVHIVGVLKDFIFKPVTYSLAPMLLRYSPSEWDFLNIKIHGRDVTGALSHFESVWGNIDPVHPFAYRFYDDLLQQVYSRFHDLLIIVGFLSTLAFVIAMLGLLGMAVFNAESKIKEVGIRKVLGAEFRNLVILLSRNDFFLLLTASAVAVPVGLFLVEQFLQTFAYRIEIGFHLVLPGLLTVFLLAGLTIGWQAMRAALSNPVKALRYE